MDNPDGASLLRTVVDVAVVLVVYFGLQATGLRNLSRIPRILVSAVVIFIAIFVLRLVWP